MTNTKKTLSMIMALTILSSSTCSMSAFAEDGPKKSDPTGSGYTETDLDVSVDAEVQGNSGTVLNGETAEEVEDNIVKITDSESEAKIYVEVSWEELKFVYDFGTIKKYEWDIDALDYVPVYDYENGEGEGWIDDDAIITFTNYSNRDVYAGVSFEINAEEDAYKGVSASFDHDEVLLPTAVVNKLQDIDITMTVEGAPDKSLKKDDAGKYPELGKLKFYISEESRLPAPAPEEEAEEATESGEHVCHYVYDQFGRLVCTGCNKVKHEYCIDEDEDGLCDECGLERDFCPDCHIGGTCKCT